MKKKNRYAFTLMEVMVVVAILALVAAIGIPSFRNSFSQAEIRMKQTNAASVEAAKEQWALLNNKPNGTSVSWDDIEDYMGLGIDDLEDLDVNGCPIILNRIGTEAAYSEAE